MGIMEKMDSTTIKYIGVIVRNYYILYWGYIGAMLGLSWNLGYIVYKGFSRVM